MRNLLLTLCFHGARFHGSAVQKNAATVQGTLQPVLERVTGGPLALKCCSRTDAGVHARMFCVSFHTHSAIPCGRLVAALNASLPDGVAPVGCREVPPDFHARYSCKGKRYVYRVLNRDLRDPFDGGMSWRYPRRLDEALLSGAARRFLGTHDFSAFRTAGGGTEDPVRTLTEAAVWRSGEHVLFGFTGDGFLYHMVRILVGTLIGISEGKIPPDGIPGIFNSLDRRRAGITAPAHGLCLEEVYY